MLSNREIRYLRKHNRISHEDQRLVEGISPENRMCLIRYPERRSELSHVADASMGALDRAYTASKVKPVFEADRVWRTLSGRIARFISKFLTGRFFSAVKDL